jgi:RNA polymerase sigma-70 factor, ECF subfamily
VETAPPVEKETDLLARARKGDVDAFSRLIELHDRGMRALAFHVLGDRDRMDDALQEAYLKAFRSLSGFAGHFRVMAVPHRLQRLYGPALKRTAARTARGVGRCRRCPRHRL